MLNYTGLWCKGVCIFCHLCKLYFLGLKIKESIELSILPPPFGIWQVAEMFLSFRKLLCSSVCLMRAGQLLALCSHWAWSYAGERRDTWVCLQARELGVERDRVLLDSKHRAFPKIRLVIGEMHVHGKPRVHPKGLRQVQGGGWLQTLWNSDHWPQRLIQGWHLFKIKHSRWADVPAEVLRVKS
jgi:hypothetical protein